MTQELRHGSDYSPLSTESPSLIYAQSGLLTMGQDGDFLNLHHATKK